GNAGYVDADAVQVTRVSAPLPKAVWTPTLPSRDTYDVYAWWIDIAGATNAPFKVFHEGGSTTVIKNQREDGATWQYLGTFVMAPGQNHRVELGDIANGPVVADAIKFVPKSGQKVASWSYTPGVTGPHKIFAKWPASSTNATDAVYS